MNTKRIIENATHGIIGRVTQSMFAYHGWGSVARDENGTLYAVVSGGRAEHICPFGKTLMYVSKNDGKTWSPPIIINDTAMDDRDTGILYLGNGRLLVTWFTHSALSYNTVYRDWICKNAPLAVREGVEGMLAGYEHLPAKWQRAGSYIRISEDYGVTWGETIEIPISAPHGPTLCRDGSLIYLGTQIYEEDGVTLAHGQRVAHLYRSCDGGYTWQKESTAHAPDWMSEDQFLEEPHVLELPDGRLIGAFRISGLFTTGIAFSEDGGKSWGEIRKTGFEGSPPYLMLHSSGALLCFFGRRKTPCGEYVAVSYDMGESWQEQYLLSEPKKDWDGDLGYPAAVELGDGSILCVYYQHYGDDPKTSFLYTRWTLER